MQQTNTFVFAYSFNLTLKQTQKLNDGYEVYSTSIDDPRCDELKLLPKATRPRVVLASFPGSGNTWLRYLIEKTTGVYTGSVYNEPLLISKGNSTFLL